MNEKPCQTLCTIMRDYGREVAQDPKRCKALLLDLCGEHKREINVLVSAMDERIASDLLNLPPNIPPQMRMPQLVKRLHDHTAIAETLGRCSTTPEEPESPGDGRQQRYSFGTMLFMLETKRVREERIWVISDDGTFTRH
jgi:hypothetical protein